MGRMVEAGEVDALVPERVWQEVSRGLAERHPSRMLAVLRACGALARLEPELDAALRDAPDAGAVVDAAAAAGEPVDVRFAALVLEPSRPDAGPPDPDDVAAERARRIARRLKAPNDARDLAALAARERAVLAHGALLDCEAVVGLLERCDAFRKPARFEGMLRAGDSARRAAGARATASADDPRLRRALAAARAVDAGAIAARAGSDGGPTAIAGALRAARIVAVGAADAVR
jgi:tRNA nucleotidyltransferase (CCA-adding enzyme)